MLFYSLLATLNEEEQDCAIRIFETHQNFIYNVAYQILQKTHDAEEIVDEVMISVIKHIYRFQDADETAVLAQLSVYSRNAAINMYRKNKRRNAIEESSVIDDEEREEMEFPDEAANVEEIILSKETAEIVSKHIQKLPIHLQDTLQLVYGFGYSNVEAAQILHVTPNAVTLRLFKARKLLKKKFGGELNERI